MLKGHVVKYLPALRLADETTAARVSIAHPLTNCGGWCGDDGTYTSEDDEAITRFVATRLPQLPQVFPLVKWFSYNNSGFILGGRVIEVVTGSHYDAATAELVFDPLEAHDTLRYVRIHLNEPTAGHCRCCRSRRCSGCSSPRSTFRDWI